MSTELPWDHFEEEDELPYKDGTWPVPPPPPPPPPPGGNEPPTPVDTGKKLVRADARNRSARTLIQGLLVDLLAALIAAIATLGGANLLDRQTWIAFGVLVLKSFLSAGISYFMRLRAAPTIRTKGDEMQVVPVMVPTQQSRGA